jgi:hypothetical protein
MGNALGMAKIVFYGVLMGVFPDAVSSYPYKQWKKGRSRWKTGEHFGFLLIR